MRKLLEACLVLAVHTLVVAAKRRHVSFTNCPLAKATSGLMTIQPARSKIECSVICLNDPHCMSASYCKTTEGYTCQLSRAYANGSCSGLVADGTCSQIAIVNPCENAGTFYPGNRTCHCVEGFTGEYCQRRYRDCSESPKIKTYKVQPFGSDYIFEWMCNGYETYATVFLKNYPSQLHTWQKLTEGIPIRGPKYFLGLESLHQLTMQGVYDMLVRIINRTPKEIGLVRYRHVRVDSAAEGYALHWDTFEQDTIFRSRFNKFFGASSIDYLLDGLGAEGVGAMSLNGSRFGTFDNDVNSCVRTHNVSWWYNPLNCTMLVFDADGLYWPTKRSGRMEMELFDSVTFALLPVHWFADDDDLSL